jgi:ABC-type polysaccharide/polyol phosphate transport system ATPase subunit
LRGVGKRYRQLDDAAMLLRSVLPFRRPASRRIWALRDLDLDVREGEMVGVIGHNGAGKTTLLRLLAGVTSPTEGRVRVSGRIAPLIGLGVGFADELSGRENVMVNGMVLGLRPELIRERFHSIVDFAELWDFIDTPVKFYSSGMRLRLGFAVVAHVDPTVLLVDEILAVGDVSFQLKCFAQLQALRERGAVILVVSHSMHQIRQLCSRVVLIRRGRLEYDGDVENGILRHEEMVDADPELTAAEPRAVEILGWRLDCGERTVECDQPVELEVRLRFQREVADPQIVIGLLTSEGQAAGLNVTDLGARWRSFAPGEECDVRIGFHARLAGGRYRLALDIKERDGRRVLGRLVGPTLTVLERPGVIGMADLAARFSLERTS